MPRPVRTILKVVLVVFAALLTHMLIIYLVRPEADHLQLHLAYTRAFGLGPWVGHLIDPLYLGERVYLEGEEIRLLDGPNVDRAVVHLFWLCLFTAFYLLLFLRRGKTI